MDWTTILGEAYTDGMTDEEAQAIFTEMYVPKTQMDAEVSKLKKSNDKLSSENADYKRKSRESMTEQQKLEAERAEALENLQTQNKALQRKIDIQSNLQNFLNMGYDQDLAMQSAEAMVDGDNATVMANNKIFIEKDRAMQRKAWEQEYSINPPAGNSGGKVDFSKQIAEAQDRGDMVTVASLIRQQGEANN